MIHKLCSELLSEGEISGNQMPSLVFFNKSMVRSLMILVAVGLFVFKMSLKCSRVST